MFEIAQNYDNTRTSLIGLYMKFNWPIHNGTFRTVYFLNAQVTFAAKPKIKMHSFCMGVHLKSRLRSIYTKQTWEIFNKCKLITSIYWNKNRFSLKFHFKLVIIVRTYKLSLLILSLQYISYKNKYFKCTMYTMSNGIESLTQTLIFKFLYLCNLQS